MDGGSQRRPAKKAVVVGGSIAGLSCAHALLSAGWDVIVIEKSAAPPETSPTGAGLSLEPQAREIINRWLSDPHAADGITLPLTVELHRHVDRTLVRDDQFPYRCAHWTDLHAAICKALPPAIVRWGHRFVALRIAGDMNSVIIRALVTETNEVVEIAGDLLVAADGSLSMIRKHFLPEHKLRYSGYSAWRGVYDYSGEENSATMIGIRNAYPELGNCLYFDMGEEAHCALFEIKNKRINWIWYFNRPEPQLQGNSVTIKVDNNMIQKMHEEAEKLWRPELARLMEDTKEPFINVIYDTDPLPQLVFDDKVVLVGDAGHPTTPHGSRSTNMSILDAAILGRCIEKCGTENLALALKEFQSIRLPVVSAQVLHSRRLGRLKQGLAVDGDKVFDPKTATAEECLALRHRTLPFFDGVPFDGVPVAE